MNGDIITWHMAWSWLSVGIILLILEIMTPGLVFVFFGLAALVLAALVAIWPGCPPVWQTVIFSALSVIFVLALRRFFKRVFTGKRKNVSDSGLADDFVGHHVVVTAAIDGLRPGRVSLNGTNWQAVSEQPIPEGVVVEILSQENLTLNVRQVMKQQ